MHARMHNNHFMALWTLSRTTRVSRYQKVHFAIFWVFWSKMKVIQADAPTIWMDCQPIQTKWCPTSVILTIFMQDALLYTSLPIYPGLGQAPNMLACIPGGQATQINYINNYSSIWLPIKVNITQKISKQQCYVLYSVLNWMQLLHTAQKLSFVFITNFFLFWSWNVLISCFLSRMELNAAAIFHRTIQNMSIQVQHSHNLGDNNTATRQHDQQWQTITGSILYQHQFSIKTMKCHIISQQHFSSIKTEANSNKDITKKEHDMPIKQQCLVTLISQILTITD